MRPWWLPLWNGAGYVCRYCVGNPRVALGFVTAAMVDIEVMDLGWDDFVNRSLFSAITIIALLLGILIGITSYHLVRKRRR